jgi:hypothetical protein
MAVRNFVPWQYTDRNGQNFVRRADSLQVAQQGDNNPDIAVGGVSAASTVPYTEMPRNLRPRRAVGKDAGGYKGSIVVYTETAFNNIVVNVTTFSVLDAGGTAHVCTVKALQGEGPHGTIQ